MNRHGVRCLMLAILLRPGPLTAQAQRHFEPVDSGMVIRFQAGGVVTRGRLLAPLTALSDSAAFCRFPGPPCQYPIEPWQLGQVRPSALERLDVQVGTRAAKGATIGGIAGVLLPITLLRLWGWGCSTGCDGLFLRATITTGLFGAGVGALIGSGSPKLERRF